MKSFESQAIEILRLLRVAAGRKEIRRIELTVPKEVALYLQNEKRQILARFEVEQEKLIAILPDFFGVSDEPVRMQCYDERGSVVRFG